MISDEDQRPDDDTAADPIEADSGSPSHSPDPADQAEDVRGATGSGDDTTPERVASETAEEPGTEAEPAAESKPGTPGSEAQPASDPDAPGREAEEASGSNETPNPGEEPSASDSSATSPEVARPEDSAAESQPGTPGDDVEGSAESQPAGGGSEAEQPAADETSAPATDQSVSDSSGPEPEVARTKESPDPAKPPVVPGADLEPIARESNENLSAEERARLEAEAEEEQARREAELAAEAAGEDDVPAREPAKLEKGARYRATGKRKSAIARVILVPGDGELTVNGRDLDEYFPRPMHRTLVKQPLAATGYEGSLNVTIRVHGGGISGQASACRHGIARALTEIDAELRGDLKRRGYLTRDARVKERRKAGLKKARKRPQFSKR